MSVHFAKSVVKTLEKQLTNRLKLSILLILFILPFTIVLSQFVAEVDNDINFAQKERAGVEYTVQLRHLLEQTLEHRTLTQLAYSSARQITDAQPNSSSGASPTAKTLQANTDKIAQSIQTLDQLDQRLGGMLQTTPTWQQIKTKWLAIATSPRSTALESTIIAHDQLITAILSQIAHVGDTSNLILDPDLDTYYLMDGVINRLPQALESTAQAEAVGRQLSQTKTLSPSQEARLLFFSNSIHLAMDGITRGMQVAIRSTRDPLLARAIEPSTTTTVDRTNQFLRLVAQVRISGIQDPQIYQRLADVAIAAQLQLYDHMTDFLDRLLQVRINQLAGKKHRIQIFALFTLILILYVFFTLTRSLSQRQQAETEKQAAEAKYRHMFENALNGIFQTTQDGHYLIANPALARIYGYESPTALISNLTNIQHQLYVNPQRRQEFLDLMNRDGAVSRFESEVYRRDGQIIWIAENAQALRDPNGTIIYYEGTVEDITARKQAEASLQQANAYLRAVIDHLVDGLLVTDLDGRISRCNPSLLNLFGLQNRDLTGQSLQEHFPAALYELTVRAKQDGTDLAVDEINLSQKRIGKAATRPIYIETLRSGEPGRLTCIGTVTLIRDITTEKEVDKMKTDFISTVSHELRTPLTSVLGFAKIVKKKLDDTIFPLVPAGEKKIDRAVQQVGANLDIIMSEGERLTALINDVLDIAKMEAGKIEWNMQPLQITEVIERSIAATTALFEQKHLPLICDVESNLPEIEADRDRLIQVIINLISNAVKFTDSGSITCRARKVNHEIVVSVTDSGVGIAADDLHKVFEKFKQVGDTLTDKPKGTGLGLPICKQIVEHHGGRIWVESILGQGSTFCFTIPSRITSDTVRRINIEELVRRLNVHTPVPEITMPQGHKVVLVVDDDPSIRELLKQELEAVGYEVWLAQDGMEAIAQVKKRKPDLITLDIMMPQMNGFDVAAVLKSDPTTMDIPIIVLSIIEDRERGYRLGIDRYLTKPLNVDALLQEASSLISQGASKRKVLVVDEDSSTVKTLIDVLKTRGYNVSEANNGDELMQKAMSDRPDMIIVNTVLPEQHNLIKTLRFEKGLDNVIFLLLGEANAESTPTLPPGG